MPVALLRVPEILMGLQQTSQGITAISSSTYDVFAKPCNDRFKFSGLSVELSRYGFATLEAYTFTSSSPDFSQGSVKIMLYFRQENC